MKRSTHITRIWPMAVLAMAAVQVSHAQTGAAANAPAGGGTAPGDTVIAQATAQGSPGQRRMVDPSSGGFSAIPYSTNGYIGFNIGKPDWDLPCASGFACSESNTSYHLYTGGMFNQHVGLELGYVDFGRFDRAGGRTQAYGVNLSLVGHLPLGGLNLYGKVGTLYGRTDVSASALSGVATGKDSGWEGTYGVGLGLNLSPRSAVVLEWNRYDLNFVGVGKRDISTTSLGYVHRF